MELFGAPYTLSSTGGGGATKSAFGQQADQQKSHFMANYQINPIYYDEVSLGKFTESFLDTIIEDTYAETTKADTKGSTNNGNYLKEIVMAMEIDRVIFKFYNGVINQFLTDNQSVLQLIKDSHDQNEEPLSDEQSQQKISPRAKPPPDEDDEIRLFTWSLTFAQESLKYLLLNFFKRTQLTVKLLAKI